METKHTPGPWRVDGRDIIAGSGASIVVGDRGLAGDDASADARLIAAAPDLLAALQVAVATIERLATVRNGFSSADGTLDVARAAIAKATGVQQWNAT